MVRVIAVEVPKTQWFSFKFRRLFEAAGEGDGPMGCRKTGQRVSVRRFRPPLGSAADDHAASLLHGGDEGLIGFRILRPGQVPFREQRESRHLVDGDRYAGSFLEGIAGLETDNVSGFCGGAMRDQDKVTTLEAPAFRSVLP